MEVSLVQGQGLFPVVETLIYFHEFIFSQSESLTCFSLEDCASLNERSDAVYSEHLLPLCLDCQCSDSITRPPWSQFFSQKEGLSLTETIMPSSNP